MKGRSFLLLLSFITAMLSCRDKDPSPAVCKPHALLYDTDSVTYLYSEGMIRTVFYYGSGRQINRDDIEYNTDRQPITVSKSSIATDGSVSLDSYHSLSYEDGKPSKLVTDSYAGHFETEFTHNEKNQLTKAETNYGSQNRFVGSTRYEYDASGNIPKVFYTINFNGELTEVLARENLSFDTTEKFYKNSPELKIINEYVYGYLPNKNNCLGSTVYFYSYAQHFASPLSITFTATYDDEGKIKSLQSNGQNTSLYSGEVLFKTVTYNCN